MMSTTEFSRRFEEFLGRYGWPINIALFTLVDRWEELVVDCTECYLYGWYEFVNDCAVRTLLEKAFNDETLNPSNELEAAKLRAQASDQTFRTVLRPDAQATGGEDAPWWIRGILQRAGNEYADDVLRLFGVEIERC